MADLIVKDVALRLGENEILKGVSVAVPAGEFMMGSPGTEPHRGAEAQHVVTIFRAFAVSRFEITFAQWDACVADGGCDGYKPEAPWGRGRMPVVNVDFRNAQAYAAWLSKKTGHRYRLLSEAEWEYAARAGSAAARPWGPALTRDRANYGADPCCGPVAEGADRWAYTSPVGSFPANRFGLADMIGDVWQWVEDCGSEDYRGAPVDGSAWTSGDCTTRVVRGSAWFQGPETARSAARACGGATKLN